MKARTVFLGMALAAAAVLVGGCGAREYRPGAAEELYGTWTNENLGEQKLVIAPGEFTDYSYLTDAEPLQHGTRQIAAKWTDREGNLWYRTFDTITSGLGGLHGTRWQSLTRLSKSATVLETMVTPVRRFEMGAFPSALDSTSESYALYYRRLDPPRRALQGDRLEAGALSRSPRRVLQGDRVEEIGQSRSPGRILLGDAWQ